MIIDSLYFLKKRGGGGGSNTTIMNTHKHRQSLISQTHTHTHTLGCYHRNIVEEVAELQRWASLWEALEYNENIQEEGGITF